MPINRSARESAARAGALRAAGVANTSVPRSRATRFPAARPARGSAAGGDGGAGGTTTFGVAFLTAPGGLGGQGNPNTVITPSYRAGGRPGAIATGGDYNSRGVAGGQAFIPNGTESFSGFGGGTPWGAGGYPLTQADGDLDGINGIGSGGGGAIAIEVFGTQQGGLGTAGGIFVFEYSL